MRIGVVEVAQATTAVCLKGVKDGAKDHLSSRIISGITTAIVCQNQLDAPKG